MGDATNGAPSGPTTAPPPQTRSATMAAIRSQPQTLPAITSPSVAPAAKPAPVEAVKLEMGGGAGKLDESGAPQPTGVENLVPGDENANKTTVEAQNEGAEEGIDYAQRYREIMDSGDLAPALLEKMVLAKPNGIETPITVKEALQGYMRRSDHSRAMNEVQTQEATFKAEKQQFAGMWDSLKGKPELAVEVFGERFGEGWLDQMVQVRQKAVEEYESGILDAGHRVVVQLGINPQHAAQDPRVIAAMTQAKERLDRQRTLETENRSLKRKQQEIEAGQKQAASKVEEAGYGERFQATIKRFSDAALRAEALPVNELTKQELQQVTAQLLIAKNQGVKEARRDYTITQDLVREAAMIVRETREDGKRGGGGAQQEAPLPARMGVSPAGGGAAKQQGPAQTRAQLMESIRGRR